MLLGVLMAVFLAGVCATVDDPSGVYCDVKPPSEPAPNRWTFSLTLDQRTEALFCTGFFASLAAAMGQGVDPGQLGVSKIEHAPLRMSMWCVENDQFVAGSCEKGIEFFFAELSTPSRDSDFTGKLGRDYVVRSGVDHNKGEDISYVNWRVRYQLPLWGPVVLILCFLIVGGVAIFLSAMFCSNTGVGNVKF